MKKFLAFDMDDTIAVTKSPISDRMVQAFESILENYDVCIISGGNYKLFHKQFIDRLSIPVEKLYRIHLLPTCGTRYYRYDSAISDWSIQYTEDLTEAEKKTIKSVLESSAKKAGYWCESPAGEVIEDRESQITFSGLGQEAAASDKYAWDPTTEKRHKIRSIALSELPDLEVRIGGTTSIDVTRKGIDKAH